jgi:hypothetical protein
MFLFYLQIRGNHNDLSIPLSLFIPAPALEGFAKREKKKKNALLFAERKGIQGGKKIRNHVPASG